MKNILSIQSHVVYGHAGNSAATFPMQRLGMNVWPLNTVQFSSGTQYPQWKGTSFPAEHLEDIINGIEAIGELKTCDAILSGYLGSLEQGQAIANIVSRIKQRHPQAIYLCDPVMGKGANGGYVAKDVAEFFSSTALTLCDYLSPNLTELEIITQQSISNIDDAIKACQLLLNKGIKKILVKHLNHAAKNAEEFEMLLVSENDVLHIQRPLVPFEHQPVGVGDLTSALWLTHLLKDSSDEEALEHITAATYEVILTSYFNDQRELAIVEAQDKLVNPAHFFPAMKWK